jgi:hypothetical protein
MSKDPFLARRAWLLNLLRPSASRKSAQLKLERKEYLLWAADSAATFGEKLT